MALEGYDDDRVLAVISKPKIGQWYCADYAILSFGQGGCLINLIEIESSHERLFTKKHSPAKRYQDAITQINDWNEWIKTNKVTFINDIIALAKKLNPISKKLEKDSEYLLHRG